MLLYSDEKETRLLDIDTARNEAFKKKFVISLIRLGHSNHSPHIWAAVHTLVSLTAVPFMRVGFLPVVPKPITDRPTVRHCLTNFQSCRQQPNQISMAVWCDEGVFFSDIYLHEPDQFKDLFLCLGPFHWARILLRCQRKLLRGSGVDDALLECGVLGPGVVESALTGSHYMRALTGMLIVEDLIRSLQWTTFWENKDKTTYAEL